jgi:VIT1/CCC1 family predicted Fe2+/Mn2+ transporter
MFAIVRNFRRRHRVLEPSERIAEVLFGLIMVLTFTGSLSVAEAGRDDVRVMLVGALGCNLAWGIIDGIFYLMGCLAERSSQLSILRTVREAEDDSAAAAALSEALPDAVNSVIAAGERTALVQRLRALPEPPPHARHTANDWAGAFGVFLIVFLSTFPVALPFALMQEIGAAMRVSNAIAVALLFLAGFSYGKVIGRSPWPVGIGMVVFGLALVAMTIALGG